MGGTRGGMSPCGVGRVAAARLAAACLCSTVRRRFILSRTALGSLVGGVCARTCSTPQDRNRVARQNDARTCATRLCFTISTLLLMSSFVCVPSRDGRRCRGLRSVSRQTRCVRCRRSCRRGISGPRCDHLPSEPFTDGRARPLKCRRVSAMRVSEQQADAPVSGVSLGMRVPPRDGSRVAHGSLTDIAVTVVPPQRPFIPAISTRSPARLTLRIPRTRRHVPACPSALRSSRDKAGDATRSGREYDCSPCDHTPHYESSHVTSGMAGYRVGHGPRFVNAGICLKKDCWDAAIWRPVINPALSGCCTACRGSMRDFGVAPSRWVRKFPTGTNRPVRYI